MRRHEKECKPQVRKVVHRCVSALRLAPRVRARACASVASGGAIPPKLLMISAPKRDCLRQYQLLCKEVAPKHCAATMRLVMSTVRTVSPQDRFSSVRNKTVSALICDCWNI